jgi:hypothetical protein
MADSEEKDFKAVAADRETRCRYCWARISRGDSAASTYNVYFHVECPKTITAFPVIGQIDEKGESTVEFPDDPYARLRKDRRLGLYR